MGGSRFQLTPAVRQDIRDALAFTLERWGQAKAREYAVLIRLALREIVDTPNIGRHRADIPADALVHPIKKPGRNARHLFLYEIVDEKPCIYGLIYDAMDLPVQWADRKPR